MIKLNLGSGILLLNGYINVDSAFSYEELVEGQGKKNNMFQNAVVEKGAKFVQSDILKLPFKDNYADVIELHQVIEHFRIKDITTALKEMHRVLKPKGKLILTTPNFTALCLNWINYMTTPKNGFNIEQWYTLAEEFYGYQVNIQETHRCPITTEFLIYCLKQAGFQNTTGTIIMFPKYSPIPIKGYGLVSKILRDKNDKKARVFRTETIYMEIKK